MRQERKKPIAEGMTTEPVVARKDVAVSKAIALLKGGRFRHLPVVEGDKVIGIVSDRDLRAAAAGAGHDGGTEPTVGQIMTSNPYCIPGSTPLIQVLKEMALKKRGSAIVLGQEGRVAGIFTRSDAMWILISLLEKESQQATGSSAIGGYFFPSYLK